MKNIFLCTHGIWRHDFIHLVAGATSLVQNIMQAVISVEICIILSPSKLEDLYLAVENSAVNYFGIFFGNFSAGSK